MLNISSQKVEDKDLLQKIGAMEVLQAPKATRIIAYWLSGLLGTFIIVLFLPWQQNIRADGKVTTLRPEDRPQTVESAIAGRISAWKIREGQYVKKGDTILTLTEIKEKFFDPKLLSRVSEQVDAKKRGVEAKNQKADALRRQREALESAMQFSLQKARNKVKEAQFDLTSDSVKYLTEKQNFPIAIRQLEGRKKLFEQGLLPLVKFEETKMKYQDAQAKLTAAENKFLASQNKLLNARIELGSLVAEYTDKISKSVSDLNATLADFSESQADVAKLENEYTNIEIRNQQYNIVAPQDGFIVKTLKAGLGETIKEGEAVVTIMPEEIEIAVELYVKAMDVPMLSVGRHTRIQFDGWPAIQFSGWPAVAVGTFGGTVSVIDYVNSKEGKYRILVVPDKSDIKWPRQLRQGSGVYAWVMLDDVPIWYEIWRQLNGFPPSLDSEPDELYFGDKDSKEKKS